jgi:hypothetical protein
MELTAFLEDFAMRRSLTPPFRVIYGKDWWVDLLPPSDPKQPATAVGFAAKDRATI